MSDDVERAHMVDVEGPRERQPRQEGPPVAAPQIAVQVIGLEPQHVRVVEQRTNRGEPAVFVELGGDNCKVTLAGRLYRLQEVIAAVAHQLLELEEAHRGDAGQ
jgi:hypothetical protein